jgi:amino acid adenylation domain-containing protein
MAVQSQLRPVETVEESYPLTPMQSGMLLHGMQASHSGVDVEQIVCTLSEELDAAAFHKAWQCALERHAILRTGFCWEGLAEPRQEVHRHVRLHCEQKDWRGLSASEQDNRLDAFLQAERRRGFELNVPPLMRLALLRVGEAKYQLAWTFHHLLLDGRALVVLLAEVFRVYEAFRQGRELELPSPRPYRDYVEWLQQQDLSRAETFWKGALKGFTTPTPLVIARAAAGTSNPDTGHSVQKTVLGTAETARLRSVAKENGLTLNTLFQGAWAILLSRYCGEEEVLFGVIRACRKSAVEGAESIVGLFVNTLPMRVRIPSSVKVADWLKELREQWMAMRDYEQTPLVEIQRWSEAPRGMPLFESIFNFQDPSWDAALQAQGGPWANRQFTIRNQPSFPLWADVYGGAGITLKIGYALDRFDDATIGRMLGHFHAILTGMAADLSQRVSDLPILTEEEQRQLLVDWNQTHSEFPRDKCVHELFETQVERTPAAIALASAKEDLTYWEFNIQANRVAHHLRSLAIGPDMPVGICTHRSAEMVVGLMGILKAGGAYVPLDPAYPPERIRFMIEDSGATVLLTQRALRARFKSQLSGCRVLCIDELRQSARDSQAASNPRSNVLPNHLAYVIYTSGSTGKPKGVEISHASLVNLLAWHQGVYRITPEDRATQLAGFSFDASVWELWPYLTAGASIHVVDDETRASAAKLVPWLNSHNITVSFLPTPLAEEALAQPWPRDTALRVMLTGGDKLNRRPPRQLPFELVNHYGPTENTVVATSTAVAPVEAQADAPPPIGRPIANVRVYALDRHLRPVPAGVPGELFIGGDSLARGYRNNPALTAEKFIPHPLTGEPGARLYRTGDLVRWRPDGILEFLGRVDHQVKIRGHRIEPGEIETVLNQHPSVRESLAAVRDGARGQRQLVAYLIAKRGPRPAFKELADFLRAKLPDYMVPSAFAFLDSWPLTPNGKVDRRALPAPDQSHVQTRCTFVAPRNHVENSVAKIWSDVLGHPRIGVHDNFFELGGHSLLGAQVISRLNSLFEVSVSIRSVFEKPTVAELARTVGKLLSKDETPRPGAIKPVARESYRMKQTAGAAPNFDAPTASDFRRNHSV